MNEDTLSFQEEERRLDLLWKQNRIDLEPTSSSAEVKLIINDTQLQVTSSLVLGHRIQPPLPFPIPFKSWLGCFLLRQERQKLWVLSLKPQHFLGYQRNGISESRKSDSQSKSFLNNLISNLWKSKSFHHDLNNLACDVSSASLH